jgi:hypothetical protein
VRGLVGDPRIGRGITGQRRRTLHFGVDIVAPDGTPVYATLTGRISIHPLHRDTVMVSDASGRVFEYWHVVPTRSSGFATRYVTVIGHVEAPWGHVHFCERMGSCYLNPLRPGAMGPYSDAEAPTLGAIAFERAGRRVGHVLSGDVDVVVDAFDLPPLPVPRPWSAVRLSPAVVRWRMFRLGEKERGVWRTAFDARRTLQAGSFSSVFADDTRQNRTNRVGRYRFHLMHNWDTAALADGTYVLEVSARDTRGNAASERTWFAVANV